jgi:hypothetical protein
MGVTLLTAITVATNETRIIQTPIRHECWLIRNGQPHALLLSCPLDKLADLEKAIESLKRDYGTGLC